MDASVNLVSSALSNIGTLFTFTLDLITKNELAMVFVGIPLVGAGIGLFHRLTGH